MIKIKHLTKQYGKLRVLHDLNLEIRDGEFVVLVGPNGCGKTTLLNILAGIEPHDGGEIVRAPNLRCSAVFQNYRDSLFPWLTVYHNVLLTSTNHRKAVRLLKKLQLDAYRKHYPYQLSGGMQQKVALARAFVVQPDFILFDEPFSSLDYATSRALLFEFMDIWQREKTTTVFVSHDIDEAILLADRLILLTEKPSRIKAEIKIPFPRPRDASLLTTDAFKVIKQKVLSFIDHE